MAHHEPNIDEKVMNLVGEVNLEWQRQLIKALRELRNDASSGDLGLAVQIIHSLCLLILKQAFNDSEKPFPKHVIKKEDTRSGKTYFEEDINMNLGKFTATLRDDDYLSPGVELINYLFALCGDRNPIVHPESPITTSISIVEHHLKMCLMLIEWYYCRFPNGPKLRHGIYRLSGELEILESFRNKSKDITNGTLNDLMGMGYGKYLKDKFIMPEAWDQILNRFLDDKETSVIVITAKTGYGKSCFLCKKSEQLIEHGKIVLFWHHDNVPYPDYEKSILNLMAQTGGKTRPLAEIGNIIGLLKDENSQIIILIDGLNEHGKYVDAFRRILYFHKKLIEIAPLNVKLVLSIREKTSDLIKRDIDEAESLFYKPDGKSAVISLPPYNDSECARIIGKYMGSEATGLKYSKIAGHLKKLLKIPLMIRLYADAVRDDQLSYLDVSRKTLWKSYYKRAGSEVIGESAFVSGLIMGQMIISAAKRRFINPSIDISVRKFIEKESEHRVNVEGCYAQLCKEGYFIQHKDKESFGFCYEDFLEYVLSEDVLPEYYEAHGIEALCKVIEDKGREHVWLTNAFGDFLFSLLITKRNDQAAIKQVLRAILPESGDVCARGLAYLYLLLETSKDEGCADIAFWILDVLVEPGDDVVKGKFFQLMSSESTDELETKCIWRICNAYLKFHKDRKNALGTADALVWMSDKYFYNRQDDYSNAIKGMKEASRIIASLGQSALTWNRANLFLAHVYSDAGKTDDAWKLIEQSLTFFRSRENDGIDFKKGYATSLYYKYMIEGDASGNFSKEVVDNLDIARKLFEETGEKRFSARCMINRAIADLYLEQNTHGMDKQDYAIQTCTQAITSCEETGDYQGRAYALINRVSFAVQKAGFVSTEGELIAQKEGLPKPEGTLIDMADYVDNALNDLAEVATVYETTGEKYLITLAYANLASIAQVMKNIQLATKLIDKVIEINRQEKHECCDGWGDDTDFYNQFDAEITRAYYNRDSRAIVNKYFPLAHEANYDQGILRGLWYLWELSGNDKEKMEYKKQALETASKLGWGDDPRQSIYSPWYAGIFLQHDLRIRINDQKEIIDAAQPRAYEDESFSDRGNFFSEESGNDSEEPELADVSPSEIIRQFHNDLSIVRNDWEKFAASRLNQEVPSVGMEDEDRKEAVEEAEREEKGISGSRKRVYELAKEVGLEIKELITRLEKIGISVKSHSSMLSESDIEKIQAELLSSEPREVVEQRIRSTVIRKRAIRIDVEKTAIVPVKDQLPVQSRIDELQNSKEPSYINNSVQTEKPVWYWRSGQISRAFEEWLIQARSEENRSHAIESIKDGNLENWLKCLDESEYKKYVKEKNAIWGLFCRDVPGDTIKEKVREQGRVKWFNEKKGYGFITRELGGEIFVHFSNISGDGFRTLYDGESVEFEVIEGKKGAEAINVTTPVKDCT